MTDFDSEYYIAQCTEKDLEIERLHQRVKELEQMVLHWQSKYERERDLYDRQSNELAELRKAQGEPVAYVWHYKDGSQSLRWRYDYNPASNDVPDMVVPLYLAPPIPEDWQLVPVEPTDEMLMAANGMNFDLHGAWHTMLAAAPKQKESE